MSATVVGEGGGGLTLLPVGGEHALEGRLKRFHVILDQCKIERLLQLGQGVLVGGLAVARLLFDALFGLCIRVVHINLVLTHTRARAMVRCRRVTLVM